MKHVIILSGCCTKHDVHVVVKILSLEIKCHSQFYIRFLMLQKVISDVILVNSQYCNRESDEKFSTGRPGASSAIFSA
jgi:hypothetical protein